MIAGITVTSASLVIQSRSTRADVAGSALPRFGDASWNLSDAIDDRHSAGQAIRWSEYPAALREEAKMYVFALVNVTDEAPRLRMARSRVPSIKTIWSDLVSLRVFLRWLDSQGISSFSAVTAADLDRFARHIQDFPGKSSGWRRRAFLAVQRLHIYRDELPDYCRLPKTRPWDGATAAELASDPGPRGVNRTPRIEAEAMETLLSAALLTTTLVAKDVMPVVKRLLDLRLFAHSVAPPLRSGRTQGAQRFWASKRQLECLVPAMVEHNMPVPAISANGDIVVDPVGFGIGGWIDRDRFKNRWAIRLLAESGLEYRQNWLVVERFSKINGRRWRHSPMRADEVVAVVRQVITACFLVISYLSGVRTGEALNLRRGCITRDAKLGLTLMSGEQLKTTPARRNRSKDTIPWVVVPEVATAVKTLERLTTGNYLFPAGEFCSAEWFTKLAERARTPGSMNTDLRNFVAWFNNNVASETDHPAIPPDSRGPFVAPRLRRTLAWHIVHRPGGLVAGATQYGHVYTQVMQGYAGYADSGFANEVEFENLLARAQTLHDDANRIDDGEHVSGAAADEYKCRLANKPAFNGITVASQSQLRHLLGNPALAIHHGALLTCVYRPESAACQDRRQSDKPDWGRCRLSCANVAYTDRDVLAVQREVKRLGGLAKNGALPEPLRHRIRERHDHLVRVVDNHTRPTPDAHRNH